MNSLQTTALFQRVVDKRAAEVEAEIRAAMERESCGPEDLMIEWRYFSEQPFKVRRATPGEKWLNWLSENH
jgi:hypothetical protein